MSKMDPSKFGVNLKSSGAGVDNPPTGRSGRGIRTPLKPANVSDLKAMFDKSGDGATTTTTKVETKQGSGVNSTQKTTETRTVTRTTTSNIKPEHLESGVKVVSVTPAPTPRSNRTTGIKTADEILAKVRAERMNAGAPGAQSYVKKHTTTRTVTQTSYDSSDPNSKIVSRTVTTSNLDPNQESRDKAREFLKFSLGRVGSGKSISSNSSDDELVRSSSPQNISPRSLPVTSPRGYKSVDTSPKGFKSSSEFRLNTGYLSGDSVSVSSNQTSPRSYRSSSSASSKNSPRNSPVAQRRQESRVEIPVCHEREGSLEDEETVDSSSISEVAKKYGLSSVGGASKISPTSTAPKTNLKPKITNGTKGGTKIRLTEKKFDLLGNKPVDDSLLDKSGEKAIKFDITSEGTVSGYRDAKLEGGFPKTEKINQKSKLELKNAKNINTVIDSGPKREEIKVVHEIKVQHIKSNVSKGDTNGSDIKVNKKITDQELPEIPEPRERTMEQEKDSDKSSKGLTGWLMGNKKPKEEAKDKKKKTLEKKAEKSLDKKAEKASKKVEKASKKAEKKVNKSLSAQHSEDKKSVEVVHVTTQNSSKSESDDSVQLRKVPINDNIKRISEDSKGKMSSDRVGNMFVPPGVDKRIVTRNMSSERFEKLKFDFERGCPTEHHDKVSKDAILLPKDLPEVKIASTKVSRSESFKRKEESIFASGLKVSDFVQQINDSNVKTNPGRTWKKNTARVRSASASTPGENEYHEVSDGASSDGGCYSEGEGIYEFVPDKGEDITDPELQGKIPSRRHGIYSKMAFLNNITNNITHKLKQKTANKKASFKVKNKSNSLTRNKKPPGLQKSSSLEDGINQKREEEDWETDSNSTTYEPVDDENLYEEAGFDSDTDSKSNKKKSKDKEGKSLGEKISSQATNVLNKFTKFGKGRSKGTDSGVSATDSDADMIEESTSDEVGKSCSLSRSSSERSSGKRARELTIDAKNLRMSEDEGTSSPTPPPLPPPLPPRASALQQQNVENSPPLPPRNSDARLSLDMVIPVSPNPASQSTGDLRKKGQFGFGSKDSYLFGQQMKSSSVGDVTDSIPAEAPEPYVGYDPAGGKMDRKDKHKNSLKKKKASSVFRKSSTVDDKSVYSSSSSSSGASYCDMEELDTIVPLSMKTDSADDNYYLEPDDEQVYGSLGRTRYSTKFDQEPLYQYYTRDKVTRATQKKCLQSDDDEDYSEDVSKNKSKKTKDDRIYEDVGFDDKEETNTNSGGVLLKPRIVFEKGGSLHRALWCEMPVVKKSGVLEKMSDRDKKIQEAMFEIITSEASYLKSLNIVINVFLFSQEFSGDHSDRCVVTKRERTVLFSNIGAIRDTSERFLADLEARWKESCVLKDICDIINEHSSKNFEPYIRYCSNQKFQSKALDLLKKKTEYVEAVRRLESNPECQNLPMSSFLLLPMQRVTRLPLLVDAICHRLEPATPAHQSAATALETLNKLVKQCNEGAKKMQQAEEMCQLANQLDFSRVKEFPIRSASRHLVKKGDLVRVINDTGSRMPFGKKGATKHNVTLFLFNDLIILTKKKGNQFVVTHYCARNSIHVECIDNVEKCPHLPSGVPSGCKNLFLMVMLENNEDKQMEMVLSCNSPSDRTRWIDAVTSSKNVDDSDRVYEEWDCPQVQCIKQYKARESDELSLEPSDVVNVLKKSKDGMFEGERIHDGERGWFPVDHTEEIVNSHVRARNLKIRYRLLIKASEGYKDPKNF